MVLISTYSSYSLGYRCCFFHKKNGKNTTKYHSSVYKCKLVWKLIKCKQITQLNAIMNIIVACPQTYVSSNLIDFSHSFPESPPKKQGYFFSVKCKMCIFFVPEVAFENILNILCNVKSK